MRLPWLIGAAIALPACCPTLRADKHVVGKAPVGSVRLGDLIILGEANQK